MAEKVTGPASYFPSIEKKYGQPVEHWFDVLASQVGTRHMEMVAYLKREHGIGHANALVGWYRQKEGL